MILIILIKNLNGSLEKKMKNIYITLIVLLVTLFSSCNATTHVEFTIYWGSILMPIVYILIGAILTVLILIKIFKDFRPY